MSAALHTDRFSADGRDLWPIARFAIYKTGSRARVERRSLAGRLSPFVATQQPGRVAGFLVTGLIDLRWSGAARVAAGAIRRLVLLRAAESERRQQPDLCRRPTGTAGSERADGDGL